MRNPFSPGFIKFGLPALALCVMAALALHYNKAALPSASKTPVPAPAISGAPASTAAQPPMASMAQSPASKALGSLQGGKQQDLSRLTSLTYATGWEKESKPAFAAFNSWVGRYMAASGAARSGLEAEGVNLAKARRAAMEELMQADPEEAIASTVPAGFLPQLPGLVLNLLERRIAGTGNYNVNVVCALPGKEHANDHHEDPVTRTVSLNGELLKAFAYGRRLSEGTKYKLPLHGIALEKKIALHPSPVRLLEAGENPAQLGQAVAAPVPPAGASIAIQVGSFAMPAIGASQALELEADLVRAESGPGPYLQTSGLAAQLFPALAPPPPAVPWTTGTQRILIIRVDFSDIPGEPISHAAAQNLMDSAVKPFYERCSFYKDTMEATVSAKTYRMPYTGVAYAKHDVPISESEMATFTDALHRDSETLAAADYDLSSYDRIGLVFPPLYNIPGSLVDYGGLANIGGRRFWVNGEFDYRVVAHEIGHTYGLFHANLWKVAAEANAAAAHGHTVEYGDDYDTMGADYSNRELDFGPSRKAYISWIDPSQVVTTATTSQKSLRIYRFDNPATTGTNPMALSISGTNGRSYWVAYRKKNVENSNLQTSAYVFLHDDVDGLNGRFAGYTHLLDCTTPGDNVADAGLQIGSSLTDPDLGLTITPLGIGGNVPNEYMDVQITYGNSVRLEHSFYQVQQADGKVTLKVQRTGDGIGTLRVDYTTENDSAQAPRDYSATAGTFTWLDGELNPKTITVNLRPGQAVNGSADFLVKLSNPVGGYITRGSATVQIADPGAVNPAFQSTEPTLGDNLPVTVTSGTLDSSSSKLSFPVIIPASGAGAPLSGSFVTYSGSLEFINGGGTLTSSTLAGNFKGDANAVIIQPDGKVLSARHNIMNLRGSASISGTVLTGPFYSGTSTIIGTTALVTGTEAYQGEIFASATLIKVTGTAQTTGTQYFTGIHTFDPADLNTEITGTTYIHGTTCVVGDFQILFPTPATYSGYLELSGTSNDVERALSDGSTDPDFNPGVYGGSILVSGTADSGEVALRALALQADKGILIAGNFDSVGSDNCPRIARLSASGTLDATFSSPNPDGEVRAIAVQADARILVGGAFQNVGATSSPLIARLNADGSLDSSFASPMTSGTVDCIAIQPDGSLLVGGSFGAEGSNGLLRLLADGTVDPSFDPGTGAEFVTSGTIPAWVRAIALQSDGKIVVGGNFNSFNGTVANRLVRLNPDGSIDDSFVASIDPGADAGSEVRALAVDSMAGILAAGEFTRVGSQPAWRLVRLLGDGSMDPAFFLGTGISNTVNGLSLAGDGNFALAISVTQPSPARPNVQGYPDLPVALMAGQSVGSGQVVLDAASYQGYAGSEMEIVARRIGGSTGAISVNYSTVNGTALAGTDYVATSGTLTWEDGEEADKLISVPLSGSSTKDFFVGLGVPVGGVQLGETAWARINILTGNQVPSTPENLAPADQASLQSVQPVLMGSDFSDPDFGDSHTASQWSVFRADTGARVWDSGIDSLNLTTVLLPVSLDAGVIYQWRVRYRDNQNGWSRYSQPTSFTTHPPLAISFQSASYIVAENVLGQKVTVTVTREVSAPEINSVNFSTRDGSARAGLQYGGTTGTLLFTGTERSKSFDVQIIDNAYPTGNSRFFIDLGNPGNGGVIVTPGSTMVTIQDDEVPSFFNFGGTYSGLIGSDSNSNAQTGFLNLSLGRDGFFSASIQYGGKSYRMTGRLQPYGAFEGTIPKTNLTLKLQLDMSGKNSFSGSITDGAATLALNADRAVFDAKRYPTVLKGAYTVLIDPDPQQTGTNVPQGCGFGSFRLDGNGKATFVATLGDGTKVSRSISLAKSGSAALYVPLYHNRGSISGALVFSDKLDTDVTGTLAWFKEPSQASKPELLFPGGFNLRPTLRGSRYSAPAKGDRVLEYHDGIGNTQFNIAGGQAALSAVPTLLTWSTDNKVTSISAAPFKLTITPGTGFVKGSFFDSNTAKMIPFSGVVLQKTKIGGGMFLGTAKTTTGSVSITENFLVP